VQVTDIVHFFADGRRVLWASERSGMRHLYLITYTAAGPTSTVYVVPPGLLCLSLSLSFSHHRCHSAITASDTWQVTSLAGVDEQRGLVFFMATADTPLERHLYVTALSGQAPVRRLTPAAATHDVAMNAACTAFVSQHSSLLSPPAATVFALRGDSVDEMVAVGVLRLAVTAAAGAEVPVPPEVFSFETRDGMSV
jgi:dipeptidyl-peptidase-4